MEYDDRVYGPVSLDHPLIIDLLSSPAVSRLEFIDQAGYPLPHGIGPRRNRLEHSFGVCALLKKYGASLEEQAAGLVHDVSHSVFSHCIDYAMAAGSEKKQDYQDNIFDSFVSGTDIPEIIRRHGFDPEKILDIKGFKLLETNLPDLCADRIDYSLRDMLACGLAGQEEVGSILESLKVEEGRWVFSEKEAASLYAELFRKLNSRYYAGFSSAGMFKTVGDYVSHALSQGYVYPEDLFTTENEVIGKINRHLDRDSKLALYWRRMNDGGSYKNGPGGKSIFCKSRAVDPLVKTREGTMRLSFVDPDWKRAYAAELMPKEYSLEFTY